MEIVDIIYKTRPYMLFVIFIAFIVIPTIVGLMKKKKDSKLRQTIFFILAILLCFGFIWLVDCIKLLF